MYEYAATVARVIDGDTVELCVDLGFRMSFVDIFRLARINTPELRGKQRPEGVAAKKALLAIVNACDCKIRVRTFKTRGRARGKYGRWLAELYDDRGCINDRLVETGHAEHIDY